MRVIALVGTSGTGKSHHALNLAYENEIEAIIDDGLLIKDNKVIAGKSAKREKTTIAAVKRALFHSDEHKDEVINKIKETNPESILLLGTSERMVKKIADRLEVGNIDKTIFINDIATPDEINIAKKLRATQGKHVIPVPTFEIKKDFSGYFLNPLKIFQRNKDNSYKITEKSVVRPTFSYLGKYLISNKALMQIIRYACYSIKDVYKILGINIINASNGAAINIDLTLRYGCIIDSVAREVQRTVKREVEAMTSLNIVAINIEIKSLKVNRDKMFTR